MSGGPDSLALLLLCQALKPGLIEVATVDHGLRPESAGEAAEVARLCARLGVQHAILPVTLARGNIQDRARDARYAALGQWAAERGLAAIATAHHADDQAETLLMRLTRASGLRGLAGVRATGALPLTGTLLVRPLLSWRKRELEDVVREAGIAPADDASNRDPRFDRARLRGQLAGADWLDPAALARSAAWLDQADRALDWATGEVWDREVADAADGGFDWPLTSVPDAIRQRIVERAIGQCGGRDFRGGEVARLIERVCGGGKATLAGVIVEVKGGSWSFRAEPARRKP